MVKFPYVVNNQHIPAGLALTAPIAPVAPFKPLAPAGSGNPVGPDGPWAPVSPVAPLIQGVTLASGSAFAPGDPRHFP